MLWWARPPEQDVAPDAWWHFALCGLVGIVTCYLFIIITQYYTDYAYGPSCGNTKGYPSTDLAMGFADVRAGTRVLISLWDSLMFGRVPEYLPRYGIRV